MGEARETQLGKEMSDPKSKGSALPPYADLFTHTFPPYFDGKTERRRPLIDAFPPSCIFTNARAYPSCKFHFLDNVNLPDQRGQSFEFSVAAARCQSVFSPSSKSVSIQS
jgi:hypothetical protein